MDTDTRHSADRFTALMIFSCDYDFPSFAVEHDIHFKAILGLYQGVIEPGFVVKKTDIAVITSGDMLKGQENVLLLMPQEAVYSGLRDVLLVPVDPLGCLLPRPEYIGQWHKVNTTEALHSDAWTWYPDEPAWYVAKMPDTPTCDNLSQ